MIPINLRKKINWVVSSKDFQRCTVGKLYVPCVLATNSKQKTYTVCGVEPHTTLCSLNILLY